MRLRIAAPLVVAAALLLGVLALRLPDAQAVERGAAESEARSALGRRLFYDGDLSIDGSMACSTCHLQHHGFAEDNRSRPGVTGEPGRRNVPGLANAGARKSYTWGDASIRTLEAQALVPMLGEHPVELGMKGQEAELARRLGRNACYVRLFRAAFPQAEGRIDVGTITQALAAFQRGLISGDAPVDRFRKGEKNALSPLARTGAALFGQHCAACHKGQDMTDDRFHRVAVGEIDPRDKGLGENTGRAADMGRFRTPPLRNVAVSNPYFHDGASPTLVDAIRRHRGVSLKAEQEAALIAYLDAMTDNAFLADPRFAYPDRPCEV